MTGSRISAVCRVAYRLLVGALLVLGVPAGASHAAESTEQPAADTQATFEIDLAAPWHVLHADGNVTVNFFFFWSETCPHCRDAWPTVVELAEAEGELLQALELDPDNHEAHIQYAELLWGTGRLDEALARKRLVRESIVEAELRGREER